MRKLLILAFILVSLVTKAQKSNYDLRVDTVTYRYYMNGNWDKLIDSTKVALKKGTDFKHLRQRLGYAYFVKGNYYASQQQYERALTFDNKDSITRSYLYYCGLNTGNEAATRYWSGLLSDDLKKTFEIKPFRIVDKMDMEYNYKASDNTERGNPTYLRGGINTQLGYRLNLYQAFSTYGQKTKSIYEETDQLINVQVRDSNIIKQNEYVVSLDWTITPYLNFDIGYHYLYSFVHSINTYSYKLGGIPHKNTIDTTQYYPGNMLFSKLSYSLNRFDFALSGSVLRYDNVTTQQYGIQAGAVLPSSFNIYLRSSLYGVFDTNNSKRLIFEQTAGARFFKKLWLEGNVIVGNMNNFTNDNGLYLYNSIDPTVFRTSVTLYWNILPKISVFGNYGYDLKQTENTNTKIISNYNQHSFSGGIIWKI